MPLSTACNRDLAHTRVVTCHGYKREDGLWDIEGRIVDTKPYGFTNQDRGGWIEADEGLHDMSVRITVDAQLNVVDAEAIIDEAPHNYCKSISSVAKNLVGLKIAPGWTNKSKVAMGNNHGCTHLSELLGPVATTAIQTMASERMKHKKATEETRKGLKSPFINSCHALAADSPVVKQHWPDQYQVKTDET
ncbi:MAG: DUF2889 domain-containing protein [Gammaproteobacteria bacterium]|nr:DUF2889 domain-containing protein [Gammaproteobacteria bacterium]